VVLRAIILYTLATSLFIANVSSRLVIDLFTVTDC